MCEKRICWQRVLTALLLCGVALVSLSRCSGLEQEELNTYRVRADFLPLLNKTRYVNVDALPDLPDSPPGFPKEQGGRIKGRMGAALGTLNAAWRSITQGTQNRFFIHTGNQPVPSNGALVRVVPWTERWCAESDTTQTIEWVEVEGDEFVVRICVEKIVRMFRFAGEIYNKNPMAQKLQGLDFPWEFIFSHSVLHTDLPDHIQHGWAKGLMYQDNPLDDSPDGIPFNPRSVDISAHEKAIWLKVMCRNKVITGSVCAPDAVEGSS